MCCHNTSIDENSIYPDNDKVFNYTSFLVHEFSHSYINSIVDKYSLIKEDDTIFNKTFDKLKEYGYGSNDSILKDYLVRSITLRYLYLFISDISYYNSQIEFDKDLGFEEEYINCILDSFIIFENSRDKYKTFEDFYPVIIKNLKDKSKKKSDKIY